MNLYKLAVSKGLEPSTSGVTGRHSNQLNYNTIKKQDSFQKTKNAVFFLR